MKHPISFNINGANHGFPSDDDLREYLKRLNPRSVLIMDNLGLAVAIKGDLPDCVVVHRDFHPADGGEWQVKSPRAFVEQWKRQRHRDIVRYTANEPYPTADYAAHEAETLRLAREAGFTVCGLCWSVGSYKRADVTNGVYDNVLRAIVDNNHYIGVHEYMTVSLPATFKPLTALQRPEQLQPESWLTANQYIRQYVSVDYPDAWFLFRHLWLINRLQELGYGDNQLRDRVLITEFGYDDIRNSNNGQYVDPLRSEYGMSIYNNDMRGVNTYKKLNDVYFNMPFDKRVLREFEWWLKLWAVSPWIHSAQLFSLNRNWSIPQGHDYNDSPAIVEGLTSLPIPTRQAQNKEPLSMNTRLVAGYNPDSETYVNVNIRSDTSLSGGIVGTLPPRYVQVLISEQPVMTRDGYNWYLIEYEDVEGYIAGKFVKQKASTDTPDDKYFLDTSAWTRVVSEETLTTLREFHNAVGTWLDNVKKV